MSSSRSQERAARNEMEGGYTERNIRCQTHLNEPQGKIKILSSSRTKERAARNEMEGGYTERNIRCQTHLNEPQGKIKKCNRHTAQRFVPR